MENIGGVNGYRCFYVCSDCRQRMVLEIVSGTSLCLQSEVQTLLYLFCDCGYGWSVQFLQIDLKDMFRSIRADLGRPCMSGQSLTTGHARHQRRDLTGGFRRHALVGAGL